MSWLQNPQGIFSLHDSDNFCGSYIALPDAAEILGVLTQELSHLPTRTFDGQAVIDENVLHREWSSARIPSPYPPRIKNAQRSFDELILVRLIQLTLPGSQIDCQVPFGRKYVDLKVNYRNRDIFVEFDGPSHFISQYQRPLVSPLARKTEIEDYFGSECVIWPYWIQRCAANVRALFDEHRRGLASVWSTRAFFGDFSDPNSAEIILKITNRFGAVRESGIGYMYGDTHTNKPIHPIVAKIKSGQVPTDRLIPKASIQPSSFWLP